MAEPINGGMYAVIPAKVLYDEELRPTAKLLYGEISRLANAKGYCWAANDSFTELFGIKKNTVSELISALKNRGYIEVEMQRRFGETGDIVERRIYALVTVGAPAIGIPKNRETYAEKTGDGIPKKPNVYNRLNNRKEKNTPIAPIEVLDSAKEYAAEDGELLDAILGLLDNRAKLDKPKPVKTVRAMHGILRDLDEHSHGDRALKLRLLDKATLSNWLTVYRWDADDVPHGGGDTAAEDGALHGI